MKRINTSFWRISLFLWLLCLPLATQAKDNINNDPYSMMAMPGSSQSSVKMKIIFSDDGNIHYWINSMTIFAEYTDTDNRVVRVNIAGLRAGTATGNGEGIKNLGYYTNNANEDDYKREYKACWCAFKPLAGTFTITNGCAGLLSPKKNSRKFTGYSTYFFDADRSKSETACWINTYEKDQVYIEFEWFVPASLAGKILNIYTEYTCRRTDDNPRRKISISSISIPEASEVMSLIDPTISTDPTKPNQTVVRFYSTKELTGNLTYSYDTDSLGGNRVEKTIPGIASKERLGEIYLDASKEYYNFRLSGKYVADGNQTRATTTFPLPYIPAYRQISFNAHPAMAKDGKGSVNLSVHLDGINKRDLLEAYDMIEVERSFTPNFKETSPVGLIMIEEGKADYTLKDSSEVLLQNYQGAGTKVYYRIARSTSEMWDDRGWKTDSVAVRYCYGTVGAASAPLLEKASDWETSRRALLSLTAPPAAPAGDIDYIWKPDVTKWVLEYDGVYEQGGNQMQQLFRIDISNEQLLKMGTPSATFPVNVLQPCLKYDHFNLRLVPIPGYKLDMPADSVVKVNYRYGTVNDYLYFDTAGKLTKFNVTRGYYSDKINLKWETDGGDVDNYSIERRTYTDDGSEPWQTIATNLSVQFYTDTRVSPYVTYEYRVKAHYQCAGLPKENVSESALGYTSTWGTVDGYVRFPDGNGVPNVEVIVNGVSSVGDNKVAIFDGTGPYATSYYVASESTTPQPQSFTVQMWVKPQDIRNEITLFRFGDYKLKLQPHEWNNTFRYSKSFKVRGSEGESVLAPAREYIYSNTFYHITVTYDAVTDSIKFYQNGNLAHVMQSTVKPASTGQPAYLELGGEATFLNNRQLIALDNYLMHGRCVYDDVRLWNRALSPSEIKQNYSRILGGSENGLMLYWRFDEHDFSASNPLSKRIADYTKHGEYDVQHMDGIVYRRRTDMGTQVIDGKTYYNCEEKDLKGGMASDNGLGTDKLWYKGLTNETGYYRISGLPVQGETTYTLTPQSATGQKFSPDGGISVTFDGTNYEKNNYNFDLTSYYMLSGTVLYEGSSIPVRHASFLINGSELQRNGKAVTTNEQGEFEFYVPRGVNTVQVVKDGHTFMNNGYLLDEEGDKYYNFERPVYEVRFWDETKVKLMGRMVGGMTEGGKPLGRSLSVNNLGDSLRLVLQIGRAHV